MPLSLEVNAADREIVIAKAAKTKVIEIERGPIGKFLQDFLACPAPHTFNDGHSQAEVVAKLREAAALARGKAA